jgi:fucose permease
MEPASPRPAAFVRSAATWAAYLLLGFFAYLETVLGPLMPSLRRELHLSYGQGALHFSAFAAGMVTAGMIGNQVTARVGRRGALWGGAAGMAVGAGCLVVARSPGLTITGAGLMGIFGTLLLVTIQALLSDAHGPRRSQALTEANVVASSGSSLAALAVGAGVGAGLGWRPAILLAIAWLGLLAIRFQGVAVPPRRPAAAGDERAMTGTPRLPRLFWAYWAGIVLSVSAEWCVAYWGTDYLHQVGGLTTGAAALVMGLYLGVTVPARIVTSRLTRSASTPTLLVLAACTALAGFLLFWLAPVAPLTIAGLCVAGAGIANLFPLGLATGIGLASAVPDVASARISMGGGLAILTAPLLLGALADHVGLRDAFAVAALMLGLVLVVTSLARGRARGLAQLEAGASPEMRG